MIVFVDVDVVIPEVITVNTSIATARGQCALFSPSSNPEEQSLFTKTIEEAGTETGSNSEDAEELVHTSKFLGDNNQENLENNFAMLTPG